MPVPVQAVEAEPPQDGALVVAENIGEIAIFGGHLQSGLRRQVATATSAAALPAAAETRAEAGTGFARAYATDTPQPVAYLLLAAQVLRKPRSSESGPKRAGHLLVSAREPLAGQKASISKTFELNSR